MTAYRPSPARYVLFRVGSLPESVEERGFAVDAQFFEQLVIGNHRDGGDPPAQVALRPVGLLVIQCSKNSFLARHRVSPSTSRFSRPLIQTATAAARAPIPGYRDQKKRDDERDQKGRYSLCHLRYRKPRQF